MGTTGTNMSSGVTAHPDLVSLFNKFKLGKSDELCLKCTIDGANAIVSDSLKKADFDGKSAEEKHEAVTNMLNEDECCYMIEDFMISEDQGKIILVKWTPDTAKMKTKMIYASSMDGVKQPLVGISKEVQGADFDDVAYAEIKSMF